MVDDNVRDDNVQHGIDDSPVGDAEKGAAIGGIGGAIAGAAAGSAVGPVGTVIGAVVGGAAGALASGAAVAAVDQVDNDNTVTGLGSGATTDVEDRLDDGEYADDDRDMVQASSPGLQPGAYSGAPGNDVPGVQTGGVNADGSADTRGVTEKISDTVTGDRYDDKTGRPL